MNEQDLKHVIALLLEDAKRLQQIEPNAGTEARILLAKQALKTCGAQDPDRTKFMNFMANTITPLPCNGERVSRVYHDTMVKALRIELERLRSRIAINEIVAN
ncbi:hypothetical protein CGN74_15875 [Salmonella enterica]|nr:hypothetical protein [Salmonella enterica]EDL0359616.1 hypothetical protein [Salmonella enterica subsp. enterica serovar Litchfield]EDX5692783.1 hypothetical protein [Salmonella enterica subsp. arizonae]EJQ7234570.1 hypothetical protein [Salmonella enterica subsp. enterica]EAU2351068.1 hypothetical protein [Salmonella enterica]